MSYKEVKFMSQWDAESLKGQDDTIVISIRDSGLVPARISKEFRDVLFLEFDNTDVMSDRFIRFSLKPALVLMEFVSKHEGQATRIVINCMSGKSRSAAVAKYLAKRYGITLTQSHEEYSDWVFHVLNRVEERERLGRLPATAVRKG
jgi:predicted protein tyrosine phosphatase